MSETSIKKIVPKKSYGQNFLTSVPAVLSMVSSGDVKKGDMVIEIGPGKGVLTKELLSEGALVLAVEKDPELVEYLINQFKDSNLTVIEKDVLLFTPEFTDYKVIANIPYYITGAIIEHFLSLPNQPSKMVLLMQKEVATRIVERDDKASILSLSVNVYGKPRIIKHVNRGSFYPIPSVDSSILLIDSISRINFKNKAHEVAFFVLVKKSFSQKRKQMRSVLKKELPEKNWDDIFKRLNINDNVRAEDVRMETWLALSLIYSS